MILFEAVSSNLGLWLAKVSATDQGSTPKGSTVLPFFMCKYYQPYNNKMQVATIIEMTKTVSSFEHLAQFMPMIKMQLPNAEHCGDIEKVHIYKINLLGSVFYIASHDGATILGYYQIDGNELLGAYVIPEMRKQNLTAMFLLFLKQNEGMKKIIIGDQQSSNMITVLQKIHHRFKTSWEKGNEKVKYDPATISQFYSNDDPTGWQVVLEGSYDYSKHPKFYNLYNLKTWYNQLVEGEVLTYQGKQLFGE